VDGDMVAQCWADAQVGENGRVHFISACKQVMRFVCLGDDLVMLACEMHHFWMGWNLNDMTFVRFQ